jgi:PTH1 family peptidyl-tRNA hydrolase
MKPHLVIIGLGNPGKQYERTRHNAGFLALDAVAAALGEGEWEEKPRFGCLQREARVLGAAVLLVKPLTFMNRSGETVRKLVDYYKLDPKHQILVLTDELDIALGEVRLRMKGGPGTHNGLRSIVSQIGEEFPRLRIGIGGSNPKGEELATWVLSIPPPEEQKILHACIATIPERVRAYVLENPVDD